MTEKGLPAVIDPRDPAASRPPNDSPALNRFRGQIVVGRNPTEKVAVEHFGEGSLDDMTETGCWMRARSTLDLDEWR